MIELLVVVAIIVALLAILLPSMQNAFGIAQVATCSSNMHQVAIAGSAYRFDHLMSEPFWRFDNASGDYPHESLSTNGMPGNPARALHRRNGVDQKYLPTGEVFFCPTYELNYDEHYNPDTNADFVDFWGSYTWHYRPLKAENDPRPALSTSNITYDNPTQTRTVVMVDTPATLYGLTPLFPRSPLYEHYNVLYEDTSVQLKARDAETFGRFMWGPFGAPR